MQNHPIFFKILCRIKTIFYLCSFNNVQSKGGLNMSNLDYVLFSNNSLLKKNKTQFRKRAIQNYNYACKYRNQTEYSWVVASNLWQSIEFSLMGLEDIMGLPSIIQHDLMYHVKRLYEVGFDFDFDTNELKEFSKWQSVNKNVVYSSDKLNLAFNICLNLIEALNKYSKAMATAM